MTGIGLRHRIPCAPAAAGVLAFCLVFAAILEAQTTYGSLTGSVKDPKGLAAAGATVVARNLATNARHAVETDAAGAFHLPVLPRGEYEVTAEAPGFKKALASPVIVEVARPANIELKLELASITDQVTVTAQAGQADVNVVSPELNTTLTTKELLGLPMVRNPLLIDRQGTLRMSHVGGGKPEEIEKRIIALLGAN